MMDNAEPKLRDITNKRDRLEAESTQFTKRFSVEYPQESIAGDR